MDTVRTTRTHLTSPHTHTQLSVFFFIYSNTSMYVGIQTHIPRGTRISTHDITSDGGRHILLPDNVRFA